MRMTERQWKRLDVLKRLEGGRLTVGEAAEILGLAERQVRRLRRAVEKRGADALVHGSTGRWPHNRVSEEVRRQVVQLMRSKYAGFNDQHFTEKLVAEGITLSRPTVQRIL